MPQEIDGCGHHPTEKATSPWRIVEATGSPDFAKANFLRALMFVCSCFAIFSKRRKFVFMLMRWFKACFEVSAWLELHRARQTFNLATASVSRLHRHASSPFQHVLQYAFQFPPCTRPQYFVHSSSVIPTGRLLANTLASRSERLGQCSECSRRQCHWWSTLVASVAKPLSEESVY